MSTQSHITTDFRINFSDVYDITVGELINTIMDMPGLSMRDISLGAMAKSSDVFNTSMFDWDAQKVYGTGVYIFKKRDNNGVMKPIYVGVAPKNFLDRFYSHMNTIFRQYWGWNAMLQIVATGILNLPLQETRDEKNKLKSNPSLEQALEWMKDSNLVVVDFDPENEEQMNLRYKFETLVIKGMKHLDDTWMMQKMKKTYTDETMMLRVSNILT